MEEMTEEQRNRIKDYMNTLNEFKDMMYQRGKEDGLAQGRKEAEILVKALKQIQDKDCDCSAPDTCGYCLTVCNMIAEEALSEYRKATEGK